MSQNSIEESNTLDNKLEEDVTISPKLIKAVYDLTTTGDNLDGDSRVIFTINDHDGKVIYAQGQTLGFNGNGFVNMDIVKDINREQLSKQYSNFTIIPNGNDTWEARVLVKFEFDDGSKSSFNHGQIRIGNKGQNTPNYESKLLTGV